MPGRPRSSSAPTILQTTPPWTEKIGKAFNVIHPNDPTNSMGNCSTCAVIAATALVAGNAPALAGAGETKVRGAVKLGKLGEGDIDGAWQVLATQTAPGNVYVVEDLEDHVFVVVRRSNGSLYLVDSNLQVYKQVTRKEDFLLVLFGGPASHNVLTPGDEGMRIWTWGPLHQNWS